MGTKKRALITGASSGIGRELARLCADAGYSLVLVARDKKELYETAQELRKNHVAIETIAQDLAEQGAGARLYESIEDRHFDILINCAGTGVCGQFADVPTEELMRMIRLNVETVAELTRCLLPSMINHRVGRILNVASTAAFRPGPRMAVYNASKAFVLSWSEAIRYELKSTGITVTTLCPGPTDTRFAASAQMEHTRAFKNRVMQPEQVAREGFRAMMEGRAVVVPGFWNKLTVFLSRFMPREALLRRMHRRYSTD